MKKRNFLILFFCFLIASPLFAQGRQRSNQQPFDGAAIKGRVFDQDSRQPIEYANIVLYSQQDSMQVTGTITNEQGNFDLNPPRPGRYYVEVFFLGYETRKIGDVRVGPRNREADLGDIYIEQSALMMENVEVEAERAAVTYQIDKKVINVSHQQTATSGTAIDVLENVPSVTVDIEGNVSLRGSGNFRVLIDGRPSILDASDALQQIPATSIENIEIITNPSAKYNPEGTAGIINIVMKKQRTLGRSGLFNLNGGLKDKYGGDFLLNQKDARYSLTAGADYRDRSFSGEDRQINRTTLADQTFYVNSNGDSRRQHDGWGLRGILEWYPSPSDVFSLNGRYGERTSARNSEEDFREWTSLSNTVLSYTSSNEQERSGNYYGGNLSYVHRFAGKGHEISSNLFLGYHDGDEQSVNELYNEQQSLTEGRISTEKGPSQDLRFKIDYTLPFGPNRKFEAGYQSELDRSEDTNELYEYNPLTGDYDFLPKYSHSIDYNRDIHSLYALYAGEWSKLGYQFGLRGEYTYRTIDLTGENGMFKLDRGDYFPTFHISYQFMDGQQFMASYTRRIDRPRGYYLEPFETWMDAYNVRIGNPALKPEYINSFEGGWQTHLGKNIISTELYYRVTENKVERVRSVYDANVTLHSVENVGKDYALGAEFMLNMDFLKKWNLSAMGNLYNYRVEGTLYDESFARESFNWGIRLNNSVKLATNTQFQVNGNYHSPTVSSQGSREGFFSTDLAVKQEFLDHSLSATLQIRDLFGTRKFEYTNEGRNLYSYHHVDLESPVVMLNLQYNINNFKRKRDRGGEWDTGEEGDEF
ncbi:MAG: TonB-dependent receptor [Calditrichia bacterium]